MVLAWLTYNIKVYNSACSISDTRVGVVLKVNITPKIEKIIERDKKVLFTTTREVFPFMPDHGEGDFVYDVAGNKFIDFSSFISVYNFGVNNSAAIRQKIKKQIDTLSHAAFTDFYNEKPVEFAEKLMSMMPGGFGRLFFSNSGTEANEAAIKLSKLFTKRNNLMAFYGGFHGRTLGSLALTTGRSIHRKHFGPFSGVIHVPYPNPYRCPFKTDTPEDCSNACLDYIENTVFVRDVGPEEVAAIFFEPIQGEGGYIVPPKEFAKGLKKLAEKYGILFVDDEVQAGYMRTGKFLALEHFGVTADIYTMAKSAGGGLPIGLTVARRSLGDIPAGAHSNTFGGNLASVAAADAVLTYVKANKSRLEESIKRKGAYVMKRLKHMKEEYEIVGDVRGLGLMIGVELVRDKKSKTPGAEEQDKILRECFFNGLVIMPAGVSSIRIIPPLTIDERNLEAGLDIFEDAVKRVNAQE